MRGAPYDTRDQNGYAPIHLACNHNDFESVMVLINFGADINVETVNGVTPLFMGKLKFIPPPQPTCTEMLTLPFDVQVIDNEL